MLGHVNPLEGGPGPAVIALKTVQAKYWDKNGVGGVIILFLCFIKN